MSFTQPLKKYLPVADNVFGAAVLQFGMDAFRRPNDVYIKDIQ